MSHVRTFTIAALALAAARVASAQAPEVGPEDAQPTAVETEPTVLEALPETAVESTAEAEGGSAPDVAPEPEPEPEEPALVVSAEPGRGFNITVGDTFSAQLRARIQIRNTLRVEGDAVTDVFEIRTTRLWWTGYVLDPNVRYGIQFAFGANDFEAGNPSPIFDVYLELTHLRELNVRVGQFFVPFDRARTVRESTLMTLDRSDVIRELTLDRDVGVMLFSNDFLGLNGSLGYALGFFGGEGRNRLNTNDAGFLYTARVFARPMGSFDDDQESDQSRSPEPRLMIGGAIAFNHNSDRPRGTTGVRYEEAHFDYLHLAADVVFKWSGFSFLGEIVWREANANRVDFIDEEGQMRTEYSRSAAGYILQAGMLVWEGLEFWGRWGHTLAMGATDPALVSQVDATGHEVSAGVNYYFNGHSMKVQADWTHTFGDRFRTGPHLIRLQLDASF
jgi:phosphate-selective porin OprO/OprP